jgi:hypothetical protein
MKKILFFVALLIAGLGVGVGAAYATELLLGPRKPAAPTPAVTSNKPNFVATGKILAPLVGADGRLAGYESFEVQLNVAEDQSALVTAKLPLLLHAINMRTYRTPMASGPDGMLPDIEVFRKVVQQAADDAFGKNVVKRAAITSATPA